MSKIQVNEVVNHFDNGAPDFPRGATVTGIITAQSGIHVTGGKVGIGTNNPDRVLHLAQANSTAYSGTDAFDKDYHILKLNNTTDGGTAGMQFLIGSDGEAAITASEVAGSATDLMFSTRSGGNKTEKLRIESSGNIGIGTNNPSELLHMFSSSNLTLKIQTTGASSPSTIEFKGPSNGRLDFVPDDSGSASGRIMYVHSDDSMQFSTKASGGNITERLRITSDGNVGIATDMTSQQVMLGVFGDGTGSKKPATIYQNPLTGTGSGNGFYVGINHNDQVGYVWNYEPHALSFATNNTARMGITSEGYLTPAPSGMVIRSGFYDPGTGTNATTATNSSTFTTLNVNGTGQVGHNIGKFSDDGLTYNKVSSNSHLNISISIPFYLATGGTGFGIRALLSTDDGSNYYVVSGLSDGPADKWGAGGYGGNTSGILNYTWNTRMNSSRASTILAKTGTIRFYFEVACWSSSDSLTIGDYPGYAKKGSIVVQEIAE